MTAANKKLASPDRKDRCARLTTSMAFQLVTLLKEWKDGKYKTKGVIPAKGHGIQSQHNCTECHGDQAPASDGKKSVTRTSVRRAVNASHPSGNVLPVHPGTPRVFDIMDSGGSSIRAYATASLA